MHWRNLVCAHLYVARPLSEYLIATAITKGRAIPRNFKYKVRIPVAAGKTFFAISRPNVRARMKGTGPYGWKLNNGCALFLGHRQHLRCHQGRDLLPGHGSLLLRNRGAPDFFALARAASEPV